MKSTLTFDLMVFTDEKDYLCYVEAVELLRKEGTKQKCDFIYNKEVYLSGMYSHEITDDEFLKLKQRAKEHFFVIDNTDYPEAYLDENWKPSQWTGDPKQDHLFVDVKITTTFTSNDKFYFWNLVFIVLILTLVIILAFALMCYCWKIFKYNKYVEEKRALK